METLTLFTGIIFAIAAILYCLIIGFFTFGWYRSQDLLKTGSLSPGMKVSVIIAARNEENRIADLLGDLLVQDYPENLTEIIVIDDRSNDDTAGVVKDFIAAKKLSGIKLIKIDEKEVGGKKTAITLGVSESTGDVILVTDADCRVGPGWISTLAAYFRDEKKMMVFGPVSYFPGQGLQELFQSLEYSGLMASGAGAALAGHPFLCSGANLAYRKSAFLRINGFEGNERFISGDDVFLMHKLKKGSGNKAIGFSKDKNALVRTYPVQGLLAFLDQRIRWASKSRGYRDPLAKSTAIIVFTFNLILTSVFFTGFYHPLLLLLFAGLLALKSLTELPLMWGVTGFTGNRQLMKWYLPFQAVYPFYVVVAGIGSLFNRRKW